MEPINLGRIHQRINKNMYLTPKIRFGGLIYSRHCNIEYWDNERINREEQRAMDYFKEHQMPPIEYWTRTKRPKKKKSKLVSEL